jgi:hypothetical protein
VPTPDGRVEFPVRLADGSSHDLDDLSSGEKEVLYGYMRLRSSAPRHSVVLVDEPELHLNPRLMRGLARFYFDHLVKKQENQIWLISHSDTLLREAVNLEGFGVYHMRRADRSAAGANQLSRVANDAEVERLVIELVGDLAAYRPGAKVVLFEGGGDVEFDVLVVARLFPGFADDTNLVAAGNKQQVLALHRALTRLDPGALGARFYAIHDRDSAPLPDSEARQYSWDRYHIENYLLDPTYVFAAMQDLTAADRDLTSPDLVAHALRECAADTVGALVAHEMITDANDRLVAALSVGVKPESTAVAEAMRPSLDGAARRVERLMKEELSTSQLQQKESELRDAFAQGLASGEWIKTVRGRDVLRLFVQRHVPGVGYETLRDLILARMKAAGHEPQGMKAVIERIAEDKFP